MSHAPDPQPSDEREPAQPSDPPEPGRVDSEPSDGHETLPFDPETAAAKKPLPPPCPRHYIALGDSFTAGAAGSNQRSFADRLAALLRETEPRMKFTNLGVPGAQTADVAREQVIPTMDLVPDVVTIVCGGNNALLEVRPDVSAHMAAFDDMLETLKMALPWTVMVTATTPDLSRFLDLGPRATRRISAAMERINEATRVAAARHAVPCIDIAAHPQAFIRGSYERDGYHPAPEACHRVAMAFASLIAIQLGIHIDSQEVI